VPYQVLTLRENSLLAELAKGVDLKTGKNCVKIDENFQAPHCKLHFSGTFSVFFAIFFLALFDYSLVLFYYSLDDVLYHKASCDALPTIFILLHRRWDASRV
jgi:hypothetical protein